MVVKDKMKFSWEKPIEQEILKFVRSMAGQMEDVVRNGQSEVRGGAENYAKAYRTVEKHILREIMLRKSTLKGGDKSEKDN